MHDTDRRKVLKAMAAAFASITSESPDAAPGQLHVVRSGQDRTGQPHKAARANSQLDFKALTEDTSGVLFKSPWRWAIKN